MFKRFSVYGQHIHIGCASSEDALYLTHAFAPYVPHFIALSAASPFYLGVDTYFDCSRLTVISAFPTNGVMPFLTEWQAFEAYFHKLCQLRLINSIKDLYWDIRPKPEFGTVELRICDSPLTLKRAAALGAYAQALAAFLLDTRPAIDSEIYFPYHCNRFSAMRYGLDALIFNAKTETETTLADDILTTLKQIRPYAEGFKSVPFLTELEEICHTKNTDAQRIRVAYYEENNFDSVMQQLMQDWRCREG